MEFIDHSENITELAKALLSVQKQMLPACKDATNPFTKSRYATLNSVMESCRNALLDNDIWLCQYPVPIEHQNSLGLMTKLTHVKSGQWQSSLTVVPLPKADPQGMGSAITYARRYALTAMLGMVTEDDDGESAKATKTSPQSKRQASCEVNMPKHSESYPQQESEDPLANLPNLAGVIYQVLTGDDGRNYVVATGKTQPNKGTLANLGFRWNAQRKYWWKLAEAA